MKFPKPWFRKGRGWFVTLDGKQIKLGTERDEAFAEYRQLIAQPTVKRQPAPSSIALLDIVEHFLGWCQKHRSPDTYEWYRYRLERLCRKYPNLVAAQLQPFMVQEWVDSYDDFSATTQRNYVRSVKRCYKWAKRQGWLSRL